MLDWLCWCCCDTSTAPAAVSGRRSPIWSESPKRAEELGFPAQLAVQGGVVTGVHVLLAYSFNKVLLRAAVLSAYDEVGIEQDKAKHTSKQAHLCQTKLAWLCPSLVGMRGRQSQPGNKAVCQ